MRIDLHAHLFSNAYIHGLRRVFGNDNWPAGQDAPALDQVDERRSWYNRSRRPPERDGNVGHLDAGTHNSFPRRAGARQIGRGR
jgi:hypothetical protein